MKGHKMAIFHCSVKTLGRAGKSRQGLDRQNATAAPNEPVERSAVAAAAYRSGVMLADERHGKLHDYRKKQGVIDSFIVLPDGAPPWMADRALLWNAAEYAETRKNSRVAREVVIAIPHELSADARKLLLRELAWWLSKRYGIVVDAAMHKPHRDGNAMNYHAHVMFTTRWVDRTGFRGKTRVLDDVKSGPKEIMVIRQAWERLANAALAKEGHAVRIDHRSHKERGLGLPPQIHVGVNAKGMARRGAQPKASVVHYDFRGRKVDYRQIDLGRSREAYNAEIVMLQQYKDVMAEYKASWKPEKAESPTATRLPPAIPTPAFSEVSSPPLVKPNVLAHLAEQVARMETRLALMAGDIGLLQAVIGDAPIPEGVLVRLRMLIERAWARVTGLPQSVWLQEQQRRQQEAIVRQQELQERAMEFNRAQQAAESLRQRYTSAWEWQSFNRYIEVEVARMGVRLNGLPPYEIKMASSITAKFNEVAYVTRLERRETEKILKAVNLPVDMRHRGAVRTGPYVHPPVQKKPGMAGVALRQDILQVKVLLARAKPIGSLTPAPDIQIETISAALKNIKEKK